VYIDPIPSLAAKTSGAHCQQQRFVIKPSLEKWILERADLQKLEITPETKSLVNRDISGT